MAEPFPFTGRFSDSVKTFAWISCFILLFVLIFRADYYSQGGGIFERVLIAFCFGVATFVGASLNTLLLKVFFPPNQESSWTVKHEIKLYALHFFTIAVFNYLLAAYFLRLIENFSFSAFLGVISSTLLVGLIPVVIHVLQQQKKHFKESYEKAAELNLNLKKPASKARADLIDLNNHKVIVDDLVYAESRKNYVFLSLSNKKDLTVRMTLKQLENKLAPYDQLVRCHRAFIVNLDKVNNVEGNAQGLKLYLSNSSSFVPVSRSYIPKINQLVKTV